jgi:hypothetical protein
MDPGLPYEAAQRRTRPYLHEARRARIRPSEEKT